MSTDTPIALASRLRRELDAIRANRVAYEREESTAKVGCAAAPIINASGVAIGALSVSVHLNMTDLTKMGPAVSTVAMALSREAAKDRFIRGLAWLAERDTRRASGLPAGAPSHIGCAAPPP